MVFGFWQLNFYLRLNFFQKPKTIFLMKLSAEHYIPQTIAKELKRKAITAWIVGFSIVFAWVFVIVLAPVAAANNLESVANPIYSFFSYLCHQVPERSFHIENHSFAVCSRCFGVYFGLLAGFVIYPFFFKLENTEPLPRYWLFLSLVPVSIDFLLGVFGIWENTHWSRFVTGMILGIACAVFIIPATVELAQLLLRKTAVKKAA